MSSNPHQKYVKINGISKINPEWKNWQNQHGIGTSLSKQEEQNALPVYCTQNEFLKANPEASNLPNMGFSESAQASWSIMQEDDVISKVGLPKNQVFEVLGDLFQKYEVTISVLIY